MLLASSTSGQLCVAFCPHTVSKRPAVKEKPPTPWAHDTGNTVWQGAMSQRLHHAIALKGCIQQGSRFWNPSKMACLCICARGENSPTRKLGAGNTLTPNLLPSTTNMPSHPHSGLCKPHANRTPVLSNNHNSYMQMQRQLPNCTLQLATTRQHLMLLCCPVCRCSAPLAKSQQTSGPTPPRGCHPTAATTCHSKS